MTRGKIRQSRLRNKAHRFPVEIFSEIFLYTIRANPRSQRELMLVCRHWHDIMLSIPGIHSQLRIHRGTERRDVERFGKRWLLDLTVDPEHEPAYRYWYRPDIDTVEFRACFMAAAEAASRWRSLAILSLPPHGEYKDLRIVHPLQHLESFKLTASCKLGNFREPLLDAITTVSPRFTVMEVFHPDAALYLLQPAHFHIFSSLTTLRIICRRMQNPVDVLPSLHKLEIFEAHHLFLPIYPPGVDLPLTRTLRLLHLKSVSVQWMTGQIFPALEECSVIFPPHSDAIQSVAIPSCSVLKYDSNNLSALEHFHISTLRKLEINCGQWRNWSGNLQLMRLHTIFAAQSLTCLHLEIKCSDRLLAYMLRLVPALEELWMRLSSPHALSTAFFLALAAEGCNAKAGPSSQMITPIGRKLRKLRLHYKRWLRGQERNGLVPAFGAVVASHPPEEQSFSFQLSFGEGSELQEWNILEPGKRFGLGLSKSIIGVSSPDGIVTLSPAPWSSSKPLTQSKYPAFPRESEYITTMVEYVNLPIDLLFSFHSLKEMRMPYSSLRILKWDPQLSLDAPLFHTLKVLTVKAISSSFFAGQTFQKLERYGEGRIYEGDIPGQGPLTKMPVCTILVVSIRRLATLKLPLIRKLGLTIDAEIDYFWEKHIAVNTNLSGLKLLQLRCAVNTWPTMAVIKILGSLPALETLITDFRYRIASYGRFFEKFVPMDVPGPSELNRSTWKGQISGVLCPRLESWQIEGISLESWQIEAIGFIQREDLMPILKDIVTLRAIIGAPLKSFTFYFHGHSAAPQKWQLIGKDKGFTIEEVVPAKPFALDI